MRCGSWSTCSRAAPRSDLPGAASMSRAGGESPFPARAVVGAGLVGGQSRRMGRDKARLSWAGEPLAARVAARVRAACGRVVLVGGGEARRYDDLGWPWWPDPPALAGAGPLAGLLGALTFAERVLLVACDMPAIEPAMLQRIIALGRGRPAAVPVAGGRPQPLGAVYGAEVRAAARASIALQSGRMSDLETVRGILRIPEAALGPAAKVAVQFHNVNDPSALEDYPELRG